MTAPRLWARLALVAGVAVWSGGLAVSFWAQPQLRSDFMQVWFASRAWLTGHNPYVLQGPGLAYDYPFPLLYPFPAILATVPIAWLPIATVNILVPTLSAGVLAWGLTRERLVTPKLLVFYSLPFLMALQLAQWSTLLAGAALVPWAGFLLICKPTIGLPLFLAYPRRSTAIACAVFGVVSVLLYPRWVLDWRTATADAPFISAPVLVFPGIVLLFAATRWRLPEARLLLGLACIPHMPILYETVLLFLIPATWAEAGILWIGSVVVRVFGPGYVQNEHLAIVNARWLNWCTYLPCLLMVLRRPADDGTPATHRLPRVRSASVPQS